MGRGAVGIKVELTLLDAILHLTAGAVELLVEVAGIVFLAPQRGYNNPGMGFSRVPFRLAPDPPFPAPAVAGLPGEILEAAGRFFGPLALLLRSGQFRLDLADEPAVLGQSEQENDTVVLAPGHQRLASKAGIATQQDAHLGPAPADLRGDPRHLLDAARAGVDVGRAAFGGQQMPAAEHVQRQIAVAVVIAVEETLFLMAVQRIGGWL